MSWRLISVGHVQSPTTASSAAQVVVPAATFSGIRLSPGKQWLEWSDDTPFMMCGAGDPEGFLYRGTRQADGTRANPGADQQTIIDKHIANGGNCLYMMAVRSHGGDGDATQNPWIDSDPANGLDQDILDQWKGWFNSCRNANIVIVFLFFDDGSQPWGNPPTPDPNDAVPAAEQAFLEAIVDEFASYGNIMWCDSEEGNQFWTDARIANRVAIVRARLDLNGNEAPLGTHFTPAKVFATDPDFGGNADFSVFYDQQNAGNPPVPDTVNTEAIAQFNAADTAANGGYVVLQSEIQTDHGRTTHGRANTREVNWASAMGGCGVQVLRWWHTQNPDPAVDDLADAKRLHDFFNRIVNLYVHAPDNARAAGQTQYVLANGPDSGVMYSRTATANLGVTALEAVNYDLYWLDTVAGTTATETVLATAGTNTFTKPGTITGSEVACHFHRSHVTPTLYEWGFEDGTIGAHTLASPPLKGTIENDASQAYLGSRYLRQPNQFGGNGAPPNSWDQLTFTLASHLTVMYVRCAFRINAPDWAREGMKVLRFFKTGGVGGDTLAYCTFEAPSPAVPAGGNVRFVIDNPTVGSYSSGAGAPIIKRNRWHVYEVWFDLNPGGAPSFKIWVDDRLVVSDTSTEINNSGFDIDRVTMPQSGPDLGTEPSANPYHVEFDGYGYSENRMGMQKRL